jgi:hypothetical protein
MKAALYIFAFIGLLYVVALCISLLIGQDKFENGRKHKQP